MKKFCLLFLFVVGLVQCGLAQSLAVSDSTIIQPGSVKTWPAGPFSEVITNYGVLETKIPLIKLEGRGQTSLDLSLVHRTTTTTANLPLYPAGRGWSHTGINFISSANGITRYSANRATAAWIFNNGIFERRPGNRDDVTQISGGYKVVDYARKSQYFFDRLSVSSPTTYYLSKVVDAFGNQVTYTYVNGTDNLFRITDPSARYIQFTYDASATTRINLIHLQAGAASREWNLEYVTQSSLPHYLDIIRFPATDAVSARPTIEFDSDNQGQITVLRTLSRKLWGFLYGSTYGGGITGVTKVYPPLKTAPTTSVDTTKFTGFFFNTNALTNSTGEIWVNIQDPMGFVTRHTYWNYQGANGQCTALFPFPIKRVNDPTVTRYLDKRNSAATTQWNWLETYHWKPADATMDQITDRNGVLTTLTYDSTNRGNLLSRSFVNQGSTNTETFTYASDGRRITWTDAEGSLTNYTYDTTTRALTRIALDPTGQNLTKNFHYSTFGNSNGEIDETWIGSDPHTIYGDFDVYGNARIVTPPDASGTTYTFDDFNNKLSMTEPSPKGTTTYTYDFWNRQLRTTFPDTNFVEKTYDLDGNIIDERMENGSHRTTTYNYLNLVSTVTVPVDGTSANNQVTTNNYDFNGRRTMVTSPDAYNTIFGYNERGDLVSTTYADGTSRQFGYDGNGNMLWRQNGRGQITYYTYDAANNQLTIDYQSAGTPDAAFTYRRDRLRTSRSDTMGTSTWTYNVAKQLTGLTDAGTNKALTFTYQVGSGRPTTMVAPGNTWSYFYDASARPWFTTQSISGEIVRNSTYWSDGSLRKRNFPNNTKAEFTYDNRGRVVGLRHAVDSLDLTQEQLGYAYTSGNMSQYTLTINGGPSYATNYTHDLAGRLLTEVRTDSTGVNPFNNAYAYTKGGDRVSTTRNGVNSAYTHLTNNRFKTGEGFTVDTYDNDGNPTSIQVPGQGTWTLTYDEDSRLIQINKLAGTSSYRYNGDGQRVQRSTPTSTFRFLLLGNDIILTTTTSFSIQAYYTPGIGFFKGGQMFFYQANALGSALVVRDSAGNWMSLTEYDGYGIGYDVQGTVKSDLRFAGAHGYLTDVDTGMDWAGSRFFLPRLGRFLTQNPVGQRNGLNLYDYANNNPLLKVVPDGKWSRFFTNGSVRF